MTTGKVKWFNNKKGYGFIQPDAGGADVFVHITAVIKAGFSSLKENDHLVYEIQDDRGRKIAANLKKVS